MSGKKLGLAGSETVLGIQQIIHDLALLDSRQMGIGQFHADTFLSGFDHCPANRALMQQADVNCGQLPQKRGLLGTT